MGSTTVHKKRKLRDSENGTDAVAATKKSKKSKDPAPPVETSSDNDEDDAVSADGGMDASDEDIDAMEEDAEESEGGDLKDGDDKDAVDNLAENAAPLLPPTTTSDRFDEMNLSDKTMRAINEMGFTKMTSIQKSVSRTRSISCSTGVQVLTQGRQYPHCSLEKMCLVQQRQVPERRWPS